MKKWQFDKPKDYRAEHLQKGEKHQLLQEAEKPQKEQLPTKPIRHAA